MTIALIRRHRTFPTAAQEFAHGSTAIATGPSVSLPSVEWLGGLSGVIDSGTVDADFSRSAWTKSFTDISRMTYDDDEPISPGAKSLKASNWYPNGSSGQDGRKTWYCDGGVSGFGQNYYSCNYLVSTGTGWSGADPDFQWKIIRTSATANEQDAQPGSSYTAVWRNGQAFYNDFNTGSAGTHWLTDYSPFDFWVRVEIWETVNDPVDTPNGDWRIRVTRISDGSIVRDQSFSNTMKRTGADGVVRYLILQNYLGNLDYNGNGTTYPDDPADVHELVVRMHDLYWSRVTGTSGAYVRGELCNNATYSSSTKNAICEILSVGGTTWTVKLNKGAYSMDDYTHLALFNASNTPTMVPRASWTAG